MASSSAQLRPHPDSESGASFGIQIQYRRHATQLRLVYVIEGDIPRLRIPAANTPVRSDGLWRHTCCEAFIRQAQASSYWEYNFSPSGAWAHYYFEAYRSSPTSPDCNTPNIRLETRRDSIRLATEFTVPAQGSLCLGLSVVLENRDSSLSYWSLHHPPGPPDFHHPDAFGVKLE